ncbi:hypothetical protein [Pantoea sp.]|uniref:hypothetical protein n=1 Tax=Pantoea sp. TaxID=69393 RepID=UPI0028ACB072|nr:hypothetical protein [Pantoea sp.]
MSISDTQSAKKYASIAQVAAAQAKLYALELENAPDYASEAQAAATAAAASSDTASQYASNAATAAASSSSSANDAANSAAEAAEAAGGAIAQTVRAPTGESLTALPAAASRINQFIVTGAGGDVEVLSRDSVPVLDSGGKLPVSVIPAIALTEPFVVNSEAAMLALDAQPGDIAKRTDLGYSFCLAASPASTLSNWVQLTDDVLAQLGLSSGATQVGATSLSGASSTVQAEMDKKPDSTDLAASTGATKVGATDDTGATTTVQGALGLKASSAALLAANGSEVGYRYSTDASLATMQSRLVQNLFINDFVQSTDAGDYGLALNRIFTKYAGSVGFTVNFGLGTFSIKTPAVYSGTAEIYLVGQNSTTLSLDGTGLTANLSIVSTRRITIESMNIIGTPPTTAGTKVGIYLNCTNQDVSHNIRSVRAIATISTSGYNLIMFDIVNPSLSSFLDCYVRYSGDYSTVEYSNNIAFRLSATTKVSTDSRFDNCSVIGCEYPYLVSPPNGTSGYLEGIAWNNCTVVDCLYGPAVRGDSSASYRSPMYRWKGGHIFAYKTCMDFYWVSQIIIEAAILYLVYDSTRPGLSAITLNETVTAKINNVIIRMTGQPNDGSSQAVYVGTDCNLTTVTSMDVYTASQSRGVVSVSGSKYTRARDVTVIYSGTAPSSAIGLGGTSDVDLGGNAVYAA